MLPNSKVCKFTEEGIVLEDETLVPCNCAVFAVGFASMIHIYLWKNVKKGRFRAA